MKRLAFAVSAALISGAAFAIAEDPFTSLHPEEAHPDPERPISRDQYFGFISAVQEKLRSLGFDAGPPNGDFGAKTQAALAQFQLSRTIPASGQLDDKTLVELAVQRDEAQASAAAGR